MRTRKNASVMGIGVTPTATASLKMGRCRPSFAIDSQTMDHSPNIRRYCIISRQCTIGVPRLGVFGFELDILDFPKGCFRSGAGRENPWTGVQHVHHNLFPSDIARSMFHVSPQLPNRRCPVVLLEEYVTLGSVCFRHGYEDAPYPRRVLFTRFIAKYDSWA